MSPHNRDNNNRHIQTVLQKHLFYKSQMYSNNIAIVKAVA